MSHADQFQILRKQKELLGNTRLEDAPVALQNKAVILSQLSARILSAPDWWQPDSLLDDNILVEVFNSAVDAENETVKKLLGEGEKAKKDLETIVDNANKTEIVPEKK